MECLGHPEPRAQRRWLPGPEPDCARCWRGACRAAVCRTNTQQRVDICTLGSLCCVVTYHGLGIVGDVHEGRRRFLGANSSLCLPVKNDGSDNTLLVLDGTIPMIYGTKRYNCPVQIWLMQDYPATQPTCYVKPTHDMAIKPRHVHVDGAGFIYHQYLTEWNPRSNLKVLCNTLSQVFGKDPPVYAKPSTGAPAARPSARPAQSQPNPAAAQEAARPQAA
eukprot:3464565-Rhodomonas_salina.1